jgi:D-alanyl-D-alanine carboxypeptidase
MKFSRARKLLGRKLIPINLGLALTFASITGVNAETNSDFEARTRMAMDKVIAAGAPGVIALVREGDETVRIAAGFGNLSPKVPADIMDRTRMGSLVKSFVAVAVLQLAGEGKLALDETVESILPDLIPNGADITVRQLLNHTSGIFDYWQDEAFFNQLLADPMRTWTPEQLVQFARAHAPLSSPGEKWSYANTNYILLGRIVEVTTGRPLAAELEARIFDRLKLNHTSFDNSPEIAGAHMHGYAMPGGPLPVDVTVVSPTAAWSAGGSLVSTAEDIANFYEALMDGRLLTPDLLSSMLTTVTAGEGLNYGLGIAEVQVSCGSAWGHQGEFPGYLNFALSSKDGNRQVVVLVNFYSLDSAGKTAFHDVVDIAFCDRGGSPT